MTRFFLAALLPFGLLATVVAAPGKPEVAPVPRPAKRVAARINDGQEVLVLTKTRPFRIRVTVLNDGKSIAEAWQAQLKTAFDYYDRDGDGVLNKKEAGLVFTDAGLAQHLQNGFYQSLDLAKFSELDANRDGKVSFKEFQAYYVASAPMFAPQPVQPDINANDTTTELLFKVFDTNGDGKLTKDELTDVEQLVASHDADDDECLSLQELVPDLYQRVARGFRQRAPAGPPNPRANPKAPEPAPQIVFLYEAEKIPAAVIMQVIRKYDKDRDYELTQAESGFDDATFRALDADGSGTLSPKELDRWRTGPADLEVTLSTARKGEDCIARLTDSAARVQGVTFEQIESGRLVLHVAGQPIEFSTLPPNAQIYRRAVSKEQFGYLFTQSAGAKEHLVLKDTKGDYAAQFQFLGGFFAAADRNGDGKVTKSEFDAYFDLLDSFRDLSFSLTPRLHTPSLFELLDQNSDGRLSVRELRTGWSRLIALEGSGSTAVTRNILQPTVSLRLSRTFERGFANYRTPAGFQNPNQMLEQQRGPTWFRKMDRNADGDVSRGEFVGTVAEFDAIDTDRDGLISLEEAEEWDRKHRGKDAGMK